MLTGSLVAIVTPMARAGARSSRARQAHRLSRRQRHVGHRHRRHDRRIADRRRRRALPPHQDGGESKPAGAFRSSPEPAPTRRPRRSRSPRMRRKPGRTARFPSFRITTSPRRKGCIATFARSRKRSTCRSCSTTCRAARSPISRTIRSCVSRRCPASSASRTRRRTWRRGSELIKALDAASRREFAVYSGDDITALPLMLMGGHGVISVTANVAPKLMAEMCRAALARRRRHGARAQRPPAGPAPEPVRRGQSDPREVGARPDGPDRKRVAAADGAAFRRYYEAVRTALGEAGCI